MKILRKLQILISSSFIIGIGITSLSFVPSQKNSFELSEFQYIRPVVKRKNKIFSDEMNHLAVKKWINRYSKPVWGHQLSAMLTDARFFEDFVLQKIDEYKLPREIFYLPVVESRYINSAKSWAGATGIWQFMATSATPYGLKINQWRDERRDFMLATDAALQKLQTNYETTGDWLLALAAYNCGLGAVTRAMKKSGTTDFWTLREANLLPTETLNYIPKFLAITHIVHYSKEYNIQTKAKAIKWTTIQITKTIKLDDFANASGIDYKILKKANAELIGNTTPQDGNPYFLKIPTNNYQKAKNTLKNYSSIVAENKNNLEKIDKSIYNVKEI